jgi:hypothetical protein
VRTVVSGGGRVRKRKEVLRFTFGSLSVSLSLSLSLSLTTRVVQADALPDEREFARVFGVTRQAYVEVDAPARRRMQERVGYRAHDN